MNEKARIIISPDPSSTFSFALELAGGADAYDVSVVPPSSDSDDLLRYIHEREV